MTFAVRRSPFARTRPAMLLAAVYMLAAVGAAVAEPWLLRGRWLALHVVTLGVLTNLVLTLSRHFAATLTRAEGADALPALWLANGGVLTVIAGMVTDIDWLVACGATLLSIAVLLNYRNIRTMRRRSVGARFGFVVRAYEWAHGAFLYGAILGLLMGAGVLRGRWYESARLAHAHVNLLGWAGTTMLATLVFFGPTMLRARIEEGADTVAAKALRWGSISLTAAVLALLGSGAGGITGTLARGAAAVGLAGFTAAAVAVCLPVVRSSRRAGAVDLRVHVVAACVWFVAGVTADAVVVLLDRRDLFDVVGLAVLGGGLAQAVLASLAYLGGAMRGGRDRLGTPPFLPLLVNAALGVVVVAALVGGRGGMFAARSGSVLLAAVAGVTAVKVVRLTAHVPSPAQR